MTPTKTLFTFFITSFIQLTAIPLRPLRNIHELESDFHERWKHNRKHKPKHKSAHVTTTTGFFKYKRKHKHKDQIISFPCAQAYACVRLHSVKTEQSVKVGLVSGVRIEPGIGVVVSVSQVPDHPTKSQNQHLREGLPPLWYQNYCWTNN